MSCASVPVTGHGAVPASLGGLVPCALHPVPAPQGAVEISAHPLMSFLLQNNCGSAQWRGAGGFLKIPAGSCV